MISAPFCWFKMLVLSLPLLFSFLTFSSSFQACSQYLSYSNFFPLLLCMLINSFYYLPLFLLSFFSLSYSFFISYFSLLYRFSFALSILMSFYSSFFYFYSSASRFTLSTHILFLRFFSLFFPLFHLSIPLFSVTVHLSRCRGSGSPGFGRRGKLKLTLTFGTECMLFYAHICAQCVVR